MMHWLMVALGGALGSMARYAMVSYVTPLVDSRVPWGTFVVNALGSFLIGVAFVLLTEKSLLAAEWRLFFMTGVLGGFTTFSAFSLEMLHLWQAGHTTHALGYALLSLVAGVLMVWAGMVLTQKMV